MQYEFYEPQRAAELLHCSESWLRNGAARNQFPHLIWGKGKIVFTDEHLEEIAKSREVKAQPPVPAKGRLIGSKADARADYS